MLVYSVQTQNRPAYRLASELVRSTVDALEPYIQTVCVTNPMLVAGIRVISELFCAVLSITVVPTHSRTRTRISSQVNYGLSV